MKNETVILQVAVHEEDEVVFGKYIIWYDGDTDSDNYILKCIDNTGPDILIDGCSMLDMMDWLKKFLAE